MFKKYINKNRICCICGEPTTISTSETQDTFVIGTKYKKRICIKCLQKEFNIKNNIDYNKE